MPITTKHHAQSNSNPGLKSDYMARTLTLALPCSLLTLLFFSITLPAHLLSESLLTILICSLLSSLGILSHCPQQMPARASCQKILAAMIWCVCAHSAKSVCAHTNLSRGQSAQTCAKNRVRKLAQRRKLALRTECVNLLRDLQKSWPQ